jgi:hypothetical protein
MPHSAWHNKGLPGFQRKTAFASLLVENYVDRTLNQVEQFVAVRMHLASMRRIPGHSGLTRESALNAGMSATSSSDRFYRSGGSETNRTLRQVNRILEWLRDRLRFHAACSCARLPGILQQTIAVLLRRCSLVQIDHFRLFRISRVAM